MISHVTCNVRHSHFVHLPGPFIAAMGPFQGCLTVAPGEVRPRDSASDVAGLRSVSSNFPLSRRTPEGVDRLCRTRPLIRVAQGCHRPVEGPMVGARAVRDHHPGRELAVALPIVAVQLEQGRTRTLRRIAVIPHGGSPRSHGLRPAVLGCRLVLLRACLGGPGRRPGAGPLVRLARYGRPSAATASNWRHPKTVGPARIRLNCRDGSFVTVC